MKVGSDDAGGRVASSSETDTPSPPGATTVVQRAAAVSRESLPEAKAWRAERTNP